MCSTDTQLIYECDLGRLWAWEEYLDCGNNMRNTRRDALFTYAKNAEKMVFDENAKEVFPLVLAI